MAQMRPIVRDLLIAAVVQVLALLFAASILDQGGVALATTRLSAAYWFGVIVVLVRRHNAPTAGDRLYLRWGLVALLVVGLPATLAWWAHQRAI